MADVERRPRPRTAALRRHGPFLVLFLVATFLLTLNVDTQFQAVHEANGVVFTGVASNHMRLGLGYTKGQDFFADTEFGAFPTPAQVPHLFRRFFDEPSTPVSYGHHPPLLGLSVALSIGVFGKDFAAVRLVPIAYTLAGLVLFYLLMVKLFDVGVARMATALYVTFPVIAYYGRNVAHESPTLFWALLMVTSYVYWRDDGPRRRWWAALIAISVVVGGGYGWPMYYAAALLFGLDWLSRRRFDRRLALLTVLPALVTGVLVLAQIAWSVNGRLGDLRSSALSRAGQADGIDAWAWVSRMLFEYGPADFGVAAVLLPVAIGFLVWRARAEGFSRRMMIVVFFGTWGVAHLLLFRQGAWIHEYWLFYLAPFLAAAIGWLCVAVARRVARPAWLRTALFLAAFGLLALLNADAIIDLYSTTDAFGRVPVRPLFS